ncbi:MAG TPA: hypothetical protein VNV42_15790 [Solirubrobacteraceae bacterium]|nr:hypothetical protein [Solirubrobacteraceae bacterium]
MSAITIVRTVCESHPSLASAIADGMLAWAGILGGLTVLCSGLPAAVALFIPSRPTSLARRINRGLGVGFVVGMSLGVLMFFVYIARIVS